MKLCQDITSVNHFTLPSTSLSHFSGTHHAKTLHLSTSRNHSNKHFTLPLKPLTESLLFNTSLTHFIQPLPQNTSLRRLDISLEHSTLLYNASLQYFTNALHSATSQKHLWKLITRHSTLHLDTKLQPLQRTSRKHFNTTKHFTDTSQETNHLSHPTQHYDTSLQHPHYHTSQKNYKDTSTLYKNTSTRN